MKLKAQGVRSNLYRSPRAFQESLNGCLGGLRDSQRLQGLSLSTQSNDSIGSALSRKSN